ncbi:MAG: xanthine dehydrogenase FAD-binding subunit XdhB [Clostridia bacterium]
MYDFSALYQAKSVQDAIKLKLAHPEAVLIAGGSDVLIKMREGKIAGCELISIYTLDELRGVALDSNATLRILPLTSFSHVTKDPLIQKYVPVLGEAVDQAGGPQLRNIGTIGGNICNGVTSADSASTLFAYDAVLEITGSRGQRRINIQEFYKGPGKVSLEKDELLTAILIKKESYENCFGHYMKYAMRNAMDIATIGCSANVVLSADKCSIQRVRIGYGVAGPIPLRATAAEETAKGRIVCQNSVDEIAKATLRSVNPRTSWRATAQFRMHIIEESARRALTAAIIRAGGAL